MGILEFFDNIIATLEQSNIFVGLRFLMGFYLFLMVAALILLVYRFIKLKYLLVFTVGLDRPQIRGKAQKRWDGIKALAASDDPNKWKAAILEAASMLNGILDVAGYDGDTLGEKLDSILPAHMDNLEGIKEANKVKNQIVQDENYELSLEEAKRVLGVFEEALRSIEAIV